MFWHLACCRLGYLGWKGGKNCQNHSFTRISEGTFGSFPVSRGLKSNPKPLQIHGFQSKSMNMNNFDFQQHWKLWHKQAYKQDPSPFTGGGGVGGVKTGIFQKERGSPPSHTPRNISDANFWFIYGRTRQWKILTQSVMHQRASVDVVRYVQSVWSKHFRFFSSPNLVCGIFEGGGEVQNHGILQL